MTYLRARPGIQTPPIAKVPRRTKLMVWGKFDGWFRVETTDHKFGWVHNELVNSPALDRIDEMSHSEARQASNRASSQLMFGSVQELKKHYQRFGSAGAKKGLAALGVSVKSRSSQNNASRLASQKAAQLKIAQARIVQAKVAQSKISQQKATQAKIAQAKANQAKWLAAKATEEKAASAQLKLAQAKAQQAKAAQAKSRQAKAEQAKIQQAKAAQAKMVAKPTPAQVAAAVEAPPTQPKLASKLAPAVASVAPSVKALSGTPLQPILPNPTTNVPAKTVTKVVTPAIPIPPAASAKTARKGNYQPPSISAEDLMRARQEHLKRSSSAPSSDTKSPKSNQLAFMPKAYYVASAVYAPSMARGNAPSGQFTPRTEEFGPMPLFVPLNRSVPAPRPTAAKTVIAKDVAKNIVKPGSNGASKPAPHRGGSPRDLARVTKNDFGQGVASQALSYRGRPYIRGAASPARGFDCSGLIYYLLRQRGLNPPRTAAGLASYGKPVPPGQLQAGDLVLFANTYKRGVSHVGIYTGNNNFVHAATSGTGVRLSSLGEAYYCRKYWGARRVQVKK